MITLEGLRELFGKRKRGERLHDGWIEQAKWYLAYKRWAIKSLPDSEWNRVVLREAERLFRALLAW